MDRKEGVIHLGRSKSPSRPKTKSITSQLRNQSHASSRQRQQNQQFVMNRSMNVNCPSRIGLIDRTNYSNTSPLFFPPSQRLVQQKLVVRENTSRQTDKKVAVISTSPFKRIVVNRPLSTTQNSHHIQNQNNLFQKQQQLLRKIRVLENRIQQIHQQKQTIIVRTHEQSKRSHNDNLILRNRLQQLTYILNIKNTQIVQLTTENNNLKNLLKNQSHVVRADRVQKTIKPSVFCQNNNRSQKQKQEQSYEKSHASLKNSPYYNDQQENISILKKQSISNQIFTDTLTQLQAQYKKLEENNRQLIEKLHQKQLQIKKWSMLSTELAEKLQNRDKQKKELVQQMQTIKYSIHNNSKIIQENNKKIVDNYENKIRLLSAELEHIKGQINENQILKSQLSLCKAEIDDYIRKLFQTEQQYLRKQQKWRIQVNNYSHIIKQIQEKHQQALKKIEQLQSIIKLSRNKQKTQEQTPTQTQQQKTTKQQCKKCKQLIKTLLKLNQKVYSRTS